MQVGDLVKLSTVEEENLHEDVGWSPDEDNDWKVGVVIEVDSCHGKYPPFYQVYWTPANEMIKESAWSITSIGCELCK